MIPTHHPSEALLVAYAAGSASEAASLAIGAHLTFCPACRDAVALAETVGGLALEDVEPSEMEPGGLESLLARLDEDEAREQDVSAVTAPAPAWLPRAIQPYAAKALAKSEWRMVAPGIRQLPLETGGAGSARLLKLKPGTVLPEHSHRGTELTLLLAGSYTDELGRFARGDMAELDEAVTHCPVVGSGEDCYALIVTEGPLKFRSWPAKVAQLLTGI